MEFKNSMTGVFMLLLLTVPQLSYADWSFGLHFGDNRRHYDNDHHYYRWHEHPAWGFHIHFLPAGTMTVWVGGARYYYYDGLYYAYAGYGDYVLVSPPPGAYVRAIPEDFHAVIINGRAYYTDNGVFYISTRRGYKVVAAPVVSTVIPSVMVVQPAAVPSTPGIGEAYPVNVPNNSGGYVTVVIKRSGNGYIGPQGEFYAQFPAVEQLKVMYAR